MDMDNVTQQMTLRNGGLTPVLIFRFFVFGFLKTQIFNVFVRWCSRNNKHTINTAYQLFLSEIAPPKVFFQSAHAFFFCFVFIVLFVSCRNCYRRRTMWRSDVYFILFFYLLFFFSVFRVVVVGRAHMCVFLSPRHCFSPLSVCLYFFQIKTCEFFGFTASACKFSHFGGSFLLKRI